MKKLILLFGLLLSLFVNAQQIEKELVVKDWLTVGTSAPVDSGAIVHIDANDKGLIIPRLTTAERDAIAAPALGLLIYNKTGLTPQQFNGVEWLDVGGGENIYTTDDTLQGVRVLNLGGNSLSFDVQPSGGDFIVGGSSLVGTEDISFQGHTLVKGLGSTDATTSLEVINSSSDELLTVDNSGFTTIRSKGSSSTTDILSVRNGAGSEFFRVGSDGVFELGVNANNSGNVENSVAINGTTAGTNGFQIAIGTSSTGCFGTGLAQVAIGYDADVNSSNSRAMAIGSNVSAADEGFAIGNRLEQTEKNSFIIGSGTGISTRLTNNVSESLALGFNTTTPSYLFAQTADSYLNGSGNLGIGTTTPDASAKLEVNSTTGGFLPPRMTTTERDAIATPAAGLVIFNTTTNKHEGYDGTTWNAFY